jgi:AraC-like DNA-binding protein
MAFSLIPRGSATLSLLTNYLQVLLRETIPLDTQTIVIAHIHELMAMTLGHESGNDLQLRKVSLRAARMRAIKSDIAANLRNRQLTINAVAARHDISARYVRELFAEENTTFTDYVLDRRLEHAYQLLTNPRFADHNIGAIAFESGFGDVSHFNHTFRRRYQSTPTAARIAALKK